MATAENSERENHIYKAVLEKINKLYGEAINFHPVRSDCLRLSLTGKVLYKEIQVLNSSQTRWQKKIYLWIRQLEIILTQIRIKIGFLDWEFQKKSLIGDSDYQKFDDALRMVVSSNSAQREQLIRYLEKQYEAGNLLYGFHVSNRALMTCLVYEAQGRHIAFVDGADGGYALAAKVLKEKLKANRQRSMRSHH